MATVTSTVTVKFTGKNAGLTETISKINNGIKTVEKTVNGIPQSFSRTTTATSGFTKALNAVNTIGKGTVNFLQNMANSFRLVSQGMMSVGKGMSIFVTPAIFLTLKKAASVAMDFDAALVRVSKTTQLTGDSLAMLASGIRDMGIKTSTSQIDLAKMAEQIGQLGVRDVPSILSLINTFNMLTIATEISADKVAIAMGKIANAFGIDLNTEKGAKEIYQLATVINRLENETAAAAPEILTALENFSQVGNLIDFKPESAAAFAAALISVGFSADEAGTALRNMVIKVVQNADEIAILMQNTAGYGDAAEVMNAINEDAVKVLIDLTSAAAAGDDKAGALFATIEAGGIRGGKAWAALAGGSEVLQRSLAVANDEIEKGLSLWYEYQTALLSTQNQMSVLKNNVNELYLVFGDTLLPVINEIVQTIIPAVRWLAGEFKKLSPAVKQSIVVFMILLGLAGPIILFLSQVGFGFSMFAIGIAKAAMEFMNIINLLASIGPLIAKIGGFFKGAIFGVQGLVVSLIAGTALLLLRFTGLGEKIADFFMTLGENAKAWGENLIATYGAGLLSGAVNVLAKVLTAIGNFIGRFLAGHSPPDVGPLSHIDLWGRNVFDAFLGGFMNADFGVLSQVGGMIQKILSTLAKVGNIGDKEQFTFAMKARQDLAKLITMFNETGEVSQSVLNDITANLGEAGDEIQQLIRYWLEYTRIQKELAELEARRTGVLDTYRQEIQLIAQSNMTAEEKADAIREAMMARDSELRSIAEEERGLEREKTIAEQQLDAQKALIDAMQDQDDLQLQLIDTLDKLSDSLANLEDFAFPEIGGDFSLDDDVSAAYEAIVTLEERIAIMGGKWDAFLAGFKGEPLDIDAWLGGILSDEEFNLYKKLGIETLPPELQTVLGQMEDMHALGGRIGGVWDSVSKTISGIGDFFGNLFGDKKKDGWDSKSILETLGFTPETIESMTESWDMAMQSIKDILGPVWDDIAQKWEDVWNRLKDSPLIQGLIDVWESIYEWLNTRDLGATWQAIGEIITGVITGVIFIFSALFTGIAWAFTAIVDFFTSLPENFAKVKEAIGAKLLEIRDNLILWGANLIVNLATKFAELKTKFGEWWENIKTAIILKLLAIGVSIATKLSEWKQKFDDAKTLFITAGASLILGVIEGIKSKINGVVDAVRAIYNAALEWWEKIWGLHSPSKVMIESGQYIMQGAIEGIESMSDQFKMSLGDATVGLMGVDPTIPLDTGAFDAVNSVPTTTTNAPITLNFGKDSVRSDKDIEDIAEAVERMLSKKASGNMSVGSIFGEEF